MDTAPRFSLILITSFITRNRHLDSSFPSYHLLQSWNLISRYVSLYRHLQKNDKFAHTIFIVETKRRINIAKEKKKIKRRKIRTIRQPLNERNTNDRGKLDGRFQE